MSAMPAPVRSRAAIGVEYKQLNDPLGLVATLAHEIGHEILLGEGRVSRDQPDHEPLTLLTVFMGMGSHFTANATSSRQGLAWRRLVRMVWPGWDTSIQRMFRLCNSPALHGRAVKKGRRGSDTSGRMFARR